MKGRLLCLITLVMMLCSSSNAQDQSYGLSLSLGIASGQMNDMKYLQEHILGTYPVEGKITSSFPPYTSLSLTGFKQLYDHIRIGVAYGYSNTGGKSSYADYSGNISTVFSATSHRLGAYISYLVLGGDRLGLYLNGRMDANFTTMAIESSYSIYGYLNGHRNKYRSISPAGSVGTELMYRLRKLSLGMEAGYLADLRGDLKNSDSGDPLLDPNDLERTLCSDWTGWYVQLKAQIWLNF
jgi:hypothetical protein